MFRSLTVILPILALLLTLLITTSAALGSLQPVHPMSAQLSHCAEHIICWLGIDTTQTSMDDARYALVVAGYQTSRDTPDIYTLETNSTQCSARLMPLAADTTHIGAIGVECDALEVSEVMSILGTPDRVGYSCDGHYIFYYGYNLVLNLGSTLEPNEPVQLVILSRIVTGSYQRRWYGFALPWRYIDLVC